MLSLLVAGLSCPATAAAQQSVKARVEQYGIDVSFQPEKSFLSARARVMIRAGEFTEALEFELNPALTILEVRDAQERKLEFTRSGRLGSPKVLVRLAEPYGAEQDTTIVFKYEGVLPRGPLDYITPEGILLRDESRWYPALDLAAFTQNDVNITTPKDWCVFTSGKLLSGRVDGAVAVHRYKTDRPVSSRSIAATPRCSQSTCGGTSILAGEAGKWQAAGAAACYSGRNSKVGDEVAGRAISLLTHYAKVLGELGLPVFQIVDGFPGQRGAVGYSAPGFLVVSEDVVKFHSVPGYAPEFLPHEIAHQWFPIEVTLARQEDGWLAEGLAEYLAYRYLEHEDPPAARRMLERALRDALEPEPLRRLEEH